MILVLDYAILETGLEFSDYSACLLEAVLFSVDSYILLHLVLHLGSDAGDLLPLLVFEELVEYPLLLHHSSSWTGFPKLRLFSCIAYWAAARPAAAPKTRHSVRELLPSLLAPFMVTHATSPAA